MEYYRIPFRPDAESAAALQSRVRGHGAYPRDHARRRGRHVVRAGVHRAARLAQGVALDYPRDAGTSRRSSRARPDFVYLSRVHPRDSARRLGDPLAPARLLESLADAVWWRPGPDGTPEAALFAVHKEAR
jgi:hypothetical protein